MLARSDPDPKMATLRARRHQIVPSPDAAALPWGRGRFPAGTAAALNNLSSR